MTLISCIINEILIVIEVFPVLSAVTLQQTTRWPSALDMLWWSSLNFSCHIWKHAGDIKPGSRYETTVKCFFGEQNLCNVTDTVFRRKHSYFVSWFMVHFLPELLQPMPTVFYLQWSSGFLIFPAFILSVSETSWAWYRHTKCYKILTCFCSVPE